MTAVSNELPSHRAESVETPSGKGRSSENFPVGSFLIRRGLRAHVHAFYRFARNADDIADNPALAPGGRLDLSRIVNVVLLMAYSFTPRA